METTHGFSCPGGCVERRNIKVGSVVRFSPSCVADIAHQDMVEQLVVILKLSNACSLSNPYNDDLYHCAVVSTWKAIRSPPTANTMQIAESPSATLGRYHQVFLAHETSLNYLHSLGTTNLYVTKELSIGPASNHILLDWRSGQYLQPTDIKRIPGNCLHLLPNGFSFLMDHVSVEIILKSVDWLAGALGNPSEKATLPEGMKCPKRQQNVGILGLLRTVDLLTRSSSHQAGCFMRGSRAQSIWDQGTVPRNGGH
jgi:hypothetical protein